MDRPAPSSLIDDRAFPIVPNSTTRKLALCIFEPFDREFSFDFVSFSRCQSIQRRWSHLPVKYGKRAHVEKVQYDGLTRYREGIDGPWSSIDLAVGSPPQDVRVLVSLAGQETWVVLPKGCVDNTTSCIDSRGNIFNPNVSSTWQNQGIYDLADHVSDLLGFVGVSVGLMELKRELR